MKFKVLGACSGLGQKHFGLDQAPDIIRKNGFTNILESSGRQYIDLGNVRPLNTNSVWHFLNQVKEKVSENICQEQVLFNLGGDHSIAIGTVGGTLEKFPDARLIWIDAHGDLNTPTSSMTGNLHGMPLAAILGLFKTSLNTHNLKTENLILIGTRDLDQFESELINALQIEVITSKEINSEPIIALDKLSRWLKRKNTPIHLSFDIDSVDPQFAPATGIRVPNGLSQEFTKSVVKIISETKKVVAVDLVELNTFQSEKNSDIQSTVDIFLDILKTFTLLNSQEKSIQ